MPRPESLAWAFLGLLEDPQYRPEFKSIFHVPDDFGGDDSSLVHILAVSWAIVEAAREIDATLDRLWRSADHERRMAQAIARHLAPTFGGAAVEDDVIRHARQAQKYVLEARTYQNPPARVVAEALGRHLEPYFISRHRKISSAPNGWRPAGRIAGLVADMTGQQVTETDVRRWCGWKNKAEAQAKAEAAATTSESIRPQI